MVFVFLPVLVAYYDCISRYPCNLGNPMPQLPFADGFNPIKMVMTWGWFMALGLPHYWDSMGILWENKGMLDVFDIKIAFKLP